MKKIYRTDLGSLISFGFLMLLFLALLLFTFHMASMAMKFLALLVIALLAFFIFILTRYDVIVTDEAIHAKRLATAFLDRYQVMRFDEIAEVWNMIGPFSDQPNIVLKSRDPSKKTLCIPIGSVLPLQALVDILERLPKDTKISFEPLLWQHLKHPPKPTTPRRVLAAALILILIIAAASSYVWWAAFVPH